MHLEVAGGTLKSILEQADVDLDSFMQLLQILKFPTKSSKIEENMVK